MNRLMTTNDTASHVTSVSLFHSAYFPVQEGKDGMRLLIKMNAWQSERLTITNGNLIVVNRGVSINWQNEDHQSPRGGMQHRLYLVRVTQCGGSSTICIPGTESGWKRTCFCFLYPTLFFNTLAFRRDTLCFLGGVFLGGGGVTPSSSPFSVGGLARMQLSEPIVEFEAFRGYGALMTCAERLVTPYGCASFNERCWHCVPCWYCCINKTCPLLMQMLKAIFAVLSG